MNKTQDLLAMAKQVKKSIRSRPKPQTEDKTKLLSTGSTLLNLVCSGRYRGGLLAGKYYFMVGDSASGKTFFSMSILAEAILDPQFANYRLIYDNVEEGNLIDTDALFGPKLTTRIEPPAQDKNGDPCYSEQIEDFYYHLDDAIACGKPFIYILDSMDGLSSIAEEDKFQQHKTAARKGTAAPGSYGDGKAIKNSQGIRRMLSKLRRTGSILLVLSQTRDNLGFGFEKKTRSGGRALRFYSTTEIWSSVAGGIKKKVRGKPRQIGTHIKLATKKNRITGKLHEVQVDIYPSYGIDDIGSCVDYLVGEGWWTKAGAYIVAKEFKQKLTREKLIAYIENNNKTAKLRSLVGRCWRQIDDACSVKRKGKYAETLGHV